MDNSLAFRSSRRAAWRLAAGQAGLTLVIAALAGGPGGTGGAWSALAGGAVGIVAGLYQALRMFSTSAADDPARFMRSVYVGEAMKILITVALFVAVIRVMKPQFVPMIAAYAATFVAYWVALGTGYPWTGPRGADAGPR